MEKLLRYLGNWGKYQLFIYFTCFVPFILSGSLALMLTFVAGVPNTRCKVPGYDDIETGYSKPFDLSDNVVNYLFPPPTVVSNAQIHCYYCNISFIAEKRNCTKELANKCSSYIYDKSQFQTTAVSQFDMVCDEMWKGEMLRTLYMIGVFLGGGIFGVIGDRYGRRKSFLIGGLGQIIVCNILPFATNYYIFAILQIFIGALQVGTYLTAFVVVMELFGGLQKTIFGILVQAVFAVGFIHVGVAAFFIRDWQWLTWSISLFTLLYIPCFYFFPESIRWLIVMDKPEQATAIIKRAAKWNGVEVPDNILLHESKFIEPVQQVHFLHLFRNRRMACVTLIIFFTWMVDSLIYYGLSWNTSSLPGNPYINFVICGLVELPGYLLCIPLMECYGRRISLFAFLFISGISCIISGFTTQVYVTLGFTFLGKMCIAAANAITYNYSTEIFPTVVRSSGAGFSNLMSRIGSMAAPQIGLLANYVGLWLPLVVYGCCGVCAALLGWLLPETKGKQMPETMNDGLNLVNK